MRFEPSFLQPYARQILQAGKCLSLILYIEKVGFCLVSEEAVAGFFSRSFHTTASVYLPFTPITGVGSADREHCRLPPWSPVSAKSICSGSL